MRDSLAELILYVSILLFLCGVSRQQMNAGDLVLLPWFAPSLCPPPKDRCPWLRLPPSPLTTPPPDLVLMGKTWFTILQCIEHHIFSFSVENVFGLLSVSTSLKLIIHTLHRFLFHLNILDVTIKTSLHQTVTTQNCIRIKFIST